MNKGFFRCTVCNDIHYGIEAPLVCPSCQNENTYIIISVEEAKAFLQDEIIS